MAALHLGLDFHDTGLKPLPLSFRERAEERGSFAVKLALKVMRPSRMDGDGEAVDDWAVTPFSLCHAPVMARGGFGIQVDHSEWQRWTVSPSMSSASPAFVCKVKSPLEYFTPEPETT